MANVVKPLYGTPTALTITLDALANGSARQSAVVDESTALNDDELLGCTITTPATGTLATGSPSVTLYVYALTDATHYTDGCTGSDTAFTVPSQVNMPPILVAGVGSSAQALSGALTVYAGPVSVAALFGGVLPQKWGVVAVNNVGVATGTGCSLTRTPVQFQAV